jgi:hypothetical protein
MLEKVRRRHEVVPPPLLYHCCKACEARATDARHSQPFVVIGAVVGLLGAATAGFNGAPLLGVVIAIATCAIAAVVYRRLVVGRRFSARPRSDGIVVAGVHGSVAQALLAVRLDVETT